MYPISRKRRLRSNSCQDTNIKLWLIGLRATCRIAECSVLVFGILSTKRVRPKVERLMQHKEGPWLLKLFKSQMFVSGRRRFYRRLWLEAQKCKHCVVFLGLEEVFIIPTVPILIEDLWRHWSPLLRMLVFGNIVVHPQSLFLQHGDVYLLKVDSIGLEKAYDILLMLFYRDRTS